jgi:hypothetical protein
VHADAVAGQLRITVQAAQPDAAAHTALRLLDTAPLRERLRAVHGAEATLAVAPGDLLGPTPPSLLMRLPLAWDAAPTRHPASHTVTP